MPFGNVNTLLKTSEKIIVSEKKELLGMTPIY
jgi:hypothetical protein